MGRTLFKLEISIVTRSRLFSILQNCIILFLIVVFVSSCVQSPKNIVQIPTPTSDPKQSGYALMNLAQPFTFITNKMADKYQAGDVKYIKENLSDLVKIARATDKLSVTPSYEDAKSYLSKMMWSQISFYKSINEDPSLKITSILPVAQESTTYFNLFAIEMMSLGHDIRTE